MGADFKCVLSDYAGVISLEQDKELIEKMRGICEISEKEFSDAYWKYREEYDQGKIRGPEYWKKSFGDKNLSNKSIGQLIQLDCQSWSRLNVETQSLIEDINRNGQRLALFSNMPPELADYIKTHIPWLKIFKDAFYSCDLGLSKPHPESFKAVMESLSLRPSEIIFIDDREENIRGAQELGIKTLHFKDAFSARKELLNA